MAYGKEFSKLRDYINKNYEVGDILDRKFVIHSVGNECTTSGYMTVLTKTGYLSKVRPGEYKLVEKIKLTKNKYIKPIKGTWIQIQGSINVFLEN